jgi:hypothetical protein
MEIADILIWVGLGLIIARFIVPRLLDFLGLEVTKAPPKDRNKN